VVIPDLQLHQPFDFPMSKLQLFAPLSGQVWPLERIPDPVFAQKMVGDGLSIDPTNAVLVAPCDAEVMSLHAAGHAITLRTAEGAEILLHIGIDTVALKGEGFRPRVKAGERVRVGAPLIEFDLDFLATHAKSLLTQIVIANSDRVTAWERASGEVTAGRDVLLTITLAAEDTTAAAGSASETLTSDAIVIPNPTGCTRVPPRAGESREGLPLTDQLQLGDRQANARSITAIMALEVGHGASVRCSPADRMPARRWTNSRRARAGLWR
jgi:phosphocarrier protein FPr